MYFYVCTHMFRCLQGPEEGVGSLGAVVESLTWVQQQQALLTAEQSLQPGF